VDLAGTVTPEDTRWADLIAFEITPPQLPPRPAVTSITKKGSRTVRIYENNPNSELDQPPFCRYEDNPVSGQRPV
jgi:hypothetical protein